MIAAAEHGLATILACSGRLEEAFAAGRRAAELWAHLAAEYPSVPFYAAEAARMLGSLGVQMATGGLMAEAGRPLEEAVAGQERLLAWFDSWKMRYRLTVYLRNAGLWHLEQGAPERAFECFRRIDEALERLASSGTKPSREKVAGIEAADGGWVVETRSVPDPAADRECILFLAGEALCRAGRVGEGVQWWSRRAEVKPDARCFANVALARLLNPARSAEDLRLARVEIERALGAESESVDGFLALGLLHYREGAYGESVAAFERALQRGGPEAWGFALAMARWGAGQREAARASHAEALAQPRDPRSWMLEAIREEAVAVVEVDDGVSGGDR
jgi:tetratricopeptide (TPR) repeat protein